ncbi:pcdc2 programmed cell death protein 2 like protein [Babesia gibsoni]|uniref:Pcdc2 programmed cell death protein 2 like protein n=1 Tax=Babesia gibsoni TaxID=33632 RepID=A0AAD8P976_BABGI|nr:pcdc2 programmed cell death protein 2 like protein [Babesia gibsoni]
MDDASAGCVELFAKIAKGDPWKFQRQFFPSKLGGFPAWLEPQCLPLESSLSCQRCSSVMTFVLQLYAPDDEQPSGDSFHRTLYLFACQPCKTQWRAFRSQLPRKNKHYPFHPEKEGTLFPQPDPYMANQCCMACGMPSANPHDGSIPLPISGKIQDVPEGIEWRALHPRCQIAVKHQTLEATLPESLLDICEGEIKHPDNYLQHEKELYRRYQEAKAKGDGEDELDESEEQAIENIQKERLVVDHSFDSFCQRTTAQDVIYYCRDGQPMWISDKTIALTCADTKNGVTSDRVVPPCELCASPRSFEFQVLPQMIFHLGNVALDFATVAVYTCSSSCQLHGTYKEEFVYVELDRSLAPRGGSMTT